MCPAIHYSPSPTRPHILSWSRPAVCPHRTLTKPAPPQWPVIEQSGHWVHLNRLTAMPRTVVADIIGIIAGPAANPV